MRSVSTDSPGSRCPGSLSPRPGGGCSAAGPPLALRRLRLRVLEYNERALRSYAKCGFAQVGREERAVELDGRWYADVLMAAELTPRAG